MNSSLHILKALGASLSLLLMLSSCSFETRYSQSAEVSPEGWELWDTLFYPVEVVDSATLTKPIAAHTPYELQLGIRHTRNYPYRELRVQLLVEFLDEQGVPQATLVRKDVVAPLTDAEGHWDGNTWGSYLTKEFDINALSISFPKEGHYRMALIPMPKDAPLEGLISLSLSIPE